MCRLVSGRQKKKKKKERHEMQRSRTTKKEEGPALKADGENDLWKGSANKKENCKGHFTNGGGRRKRRWGLMAAWLALSCSWTMEETWFKEPQR